MKKGREYEDFIFKIFSEYFKGFKLTQNDKILGIESGIQREIDVSIRGNIEGQDVLFVVQAKDYLNHKADINTIGTFSSAIKDVGAAKGYLVCASGFAKTNHQYARTLGIELLSVEDIESKKWKANVEIPVVYVKYDLKYNIDISAVATVFGQLAKIYGSVSISPQDRLIFSIDGLNYYHINQHLRDFFNKGLIDFSHWKKLFFTNRLRLEKYPYFIFPEATIITEPINKFYLKYVTPNEFRGIKDHLNKTFIPTTFKINDVNIDLDDSYTEIHESNIPVNPYGFSITIEATPL